jgi:allantoinase
LSEELDLVIRARRVILPSEGEVARTIGARDGHIVVICPLDEPLHGRERLDLDADVVLMPGLVDSHVHINEPGHTDWEGFASATAAAAAGGTTTLLDMPLNSLPVTTDPGALRTKRQAAEGQCHIDVGFLGGVVPGSSDQLIPLLEAGVFGFKCFLADSGLEQFPAVDFATMQAALGALAGRDAPLFVHAENNLAGANQHELHSRRYKDYLASRPRGYENLAIAQVIEAARLTGGRAHICHLSSSDALPMIESARRDKVSLTVESCPHYLTLCSEDIEDGATYFKCCPPIRETANRELLWGGLKANLIDLVVSDHSPSTPELKTRGNGDFGAAWGGIASLQLTLPVMWTEARSRGFSLSDVARWMSHRPARLLGLSSKGAIALGRDADFCVLAPDETLVVDPAKLLHRNPGSPYDGRALTGVVRTTILRGQQVDPSIPRGRLLSRSPLRDQLTTPGCK